MCGENSSAAARIASVGGSSPRVRGKPPHRRRSRHTIRLIPACAGKTNILVILLADPTAHPRVCGENKYSGNTSGRPHGSSPRVRGKRPHSGTTSGRRGLIPACAGKTRRVWGLDAQRGAHPRVCGENLSMVFYYVGCVGSSPRVRGKLSFRGSRIYERGLIPACAGKTTSWALADFPRRAHPRVCGENFRQATESALKLGSSPRVRGKLPVLKAR